MQSRITHTDPGPSLTFEETTRAFLEGIGTGVAVDPRVDGVDAFRRYASEFQLGHAIEIPDGVKTENRTIRGRNGDILLRVYRNDRAKEPSPILVYLHGGAWVIGGVDEYDGLCGHLAKFGGVTVVSVAYRLAPEHRFPAAVEDCYDAFNWVATNAGAVGGDGRAVAIAGDSAGGNLAAVICQMARAASGPPISQQLLFYPCLAPLDPDEYPSRITYGGRENFLNEADFQFMLSLYARSQDCQRDPRLWPILAEDLSGLPDAYIVTAEYDMLRDEARAYGDALARAGVNVVQRGYSGTIHGFMGFAKSIKPGRDALDEACAYLRRG